MPDAMFDILIIGGGVNGAAIARDAAGRGLRTALLEKGDLAGETSSKSTKLFHGGLRYLEFFEFKLVRDALSEREVLLKAMPHISWPMRFVLPYSADLQFDAQTPTSRVLSRLMPGLKGHRPAWLIRLGLFLYDHMGGRKILPPTHALDLTKSAEGEPLRDQYKKAYEYSDCWVDDARLVVLLAKDAQDRGAKIFTRNPAISAKRSATYWQVKTKNGSIKAKALVNASGPWVENFLRERAQIIPTANVRLVKGSHIVVPKLYDHEKCYILQGKDGRVAFAIPYEEKFTLIGTTDEAFDDLNEAPECSEAEVQYLCDFVSDYFRQPVSPSDVVWSYAGVRPLYDDGADSDTAATREYVLALNDDGAPILDIFGGKITTHRKLAEDALDKLSAYFDIKESWTKSAPLPGGDFAVEDFDKLHASLCNDYPFLNAQDARRLVRSYGTRAWDVLGDAKSGKALGQSFGAGLSEAEIRYLIAQEFAMTGEDILWRRSKLGLHMNDAEREEVENFMNELMENSQHRQAG